MTWSLPLGLLALLAVPAIVALHLFRRRLPERRVAGLFLWSGDHLAAAAGRTRTRLLHTPSLWLECLAAVALALWLAGPSFGGANGRHVVFVLDDSASMLAGARERAAAELRRRGDRLGASDRITLLRTGPRPAVLAGPAPPREALAALARWRPVQPRHDATPALDLARELADAGGEIVFATDTAPAAPPADVTVLAFGEPVPNAAILSAQRLPRGAGEELHLRAGGFGALAGAACTVAVGERELGTYELAFDGGVAELAVPLPAGAGAVRAALRGDAFAVDDVAWLLPPPDRTVAVCDLLPGDLRRRLELDRVFAAIGGVRAVADPRQAQLLLAARAGPLAPGQTEVVVETGDGERDGWRGPFTIDRGHPWLDGVALHGVIWLAGRRELPGQVLIAAGARALATEELADAGRRLWLALDPSAGNLVRAPDWPVLWTNVVERARLEVPGPVRGEVLLGDEVRYRRAPTGALGEELVAEAPDGARVPMRGDRVAGFVPERPGVHRVLGAGDRELARVAVRFCDPAESDLTGLATGEWPAVVPAGSDAEGGGARDGTAERSWLALLALALVLGDWWWLARRGA